jgi:Na+-translocating ferredoxin:NAD+ oxidoreductase subunit G
MSDDIRKKDAGGRGDGEGDRGSMPEDRELYTPQGGGGGTGSGSIEEVPAVRGAPEAGPKEDQRVDVPRPGELRLPQVSPKEPEEPGGAGRPGAGVPEVKETSILRMILTLATAGAMAGAVLVFVFLWSQPRILAYQAKVLAESIGEVLKGPEVYETVYVYQGQLVRELPEGVSPAGLDRIYPGYDADGRPMGFAAAGAKAGYMDLIHVIFGYDPSSQEVLGMKVLDHKETPGLGDVIVKDQEFIGGFDGVRWPLQGIKEGTATGDPHEVDLVTGATISTRTIVELINLRIEELEPLLEGFQWVAPAPDVPAEAPDSSIGGVTGGAPGNRDGKEEAA